MIRRPTAADRVPQGALAAFLRLAGRRVRWAWGLVTAQRLLPVVGAAALVLVAAGHRLPWAWPEPAALALAGLSVAVLTVATVGLRVPALTVARAADRGLGTHDAFAAALQLADTPVFGPRIEARADELARVASAREAIPLRPRWHRWAVAAVFGAAAVGLAAAPNPQDSEIARRRAEQAAVAEEASRLHEQADAVRNRPDATAADRELADRLDELARRMEQTTSPIEAAELLRQAESELRRMPELERQAREAAAQGLDRTLGARPLPGATGGPAAEQLAQAAAGLDALSPSQQAELAQRLEALAETQAAGNPELAAALRDAAGALERGDTAAARAGLERAAGAQRASQDAVQAEATRQEAADRLADARRRLDGSGSDAAAGVGQGRPQGQGEGEGEGQARGEPQGEGRGQGRGEGEVPADGAGQMPGGGSGGREPGVGGSGPQLSVFDPARAGQGPQLQAEGNPAGPDPGAEVGRAAGDGTANDGRVPLRDHLGSYADEATRALDRPDVPPAQRALVEAYFNRLAELQSGSR